MDSAKRIAGIERCSNMKHLKKTKEIFGEVAYSQEIKGIEKYRQPLDPLDNYDWLEMALEEQVDGTKYLVAEMEKRKDVIGKIRDIIESECELDVQFVINVQLERLEGE